MDSDINELYSALKYFCDSDYVVITPWSDDISTYRVVVDGGGVYKGGKFVFQITKMDRQLPIVYCHTLIWHPQVDNSIPVGTTNVDLSWVGKFSMDEISMVDIIDGLVTLFNSPRFDTDFNPHVKPKGFESKAREWVKKYAQ